MSFFYYQAVNENATSSDPDTAVLFLCLAGAVLCWSVFCKWASKEAA